MPQAPRTSSDVDNFLVKWTKEDRRAEMPERLERAMKVSGADRAKLIRALLIQWALDVEARGPAQIRQAIATINERPIDVYGSKKKAGKSQ